MIMDYCLERVIKKYHYWLSITLLFLVSHCEVCYSLFIEISDLYFPINYEILNPLSFRITRPKDHKNSKTIRQTMF